MITRSHTQTITWSLHMSRSWPSLSVWLITDYQSTCVEPKSTTGSNKTLYKWHAVKAGSTRSAVHRIIKSCCTTKVIHRCKKCLHGSTGFSGEEDMGGDVLMGSVVLPWGSDLATGTAVNTQCVCVCVCVYKCNNNCSAKYNNYCKHSNYYNIKLLSNLGVLIFSD